MGGSQMRRKMGGTGKGGERRQGRREETNSQHILAKQQTLSSCSLKHCDAPVLLLLLPLHPAPGLGRGMDGTHSGIWGLGRFPGGWGQGFVTEPQGASPRSRGCAANPARLGMGAGGICMWGPYAHTAKVSVPGIGEAGEVSHKGSQGRKKEYPTKTLDEKDVPGFGPGVTGCRQPPELHGERGASCCPSSSCRPSSCSLQAPCPLPLPPFLPRPGSHGAQGPPGCGTGCRGEVSAWM